LKIAAAAAQIIDAGQPFAVTARDGRIIGEIGREAVISLLSGKDRGP
jgi:hypothetical protein